MWWLLLLLLYGTDELCDSVFLCLLFDYVTGFHLLVVFFFFQAEDGIRDLVRSRGLGDVYKRQALDWLVCPIHQPLRIPLMVYWFFRKVIRSFTIITCLLYTSDAADERSSVDLGGRRIIKKTNEVQRGEQEKTQNKLYNTQHKYTTKLNKHKSKIYIC